MNVEAIRGNWVGQVIDGRFTLLQWLGGTERVSVFLTELPGPQALKAAIKLIPADAGDAEAHAAGWAATRPLSHPHLMRLYHTGRCQTEEGELLYSVAEYAEEVLSEILPERALLPTEAREMLTPILDALFYLHGKGLVHGHLKPTNVMVVDDRLKLTCDSLQMAGETGTPAPAQGIYGAPETAAGTISPAADVWGLGVTLVEALTQHPPAWDKSTDEDPIVPPSIPQPFAGIARGCLRADPVGRCTLDNVKTWLGGEQPVKEPAAKVEKKAPARNRLPMLVAVAIVLVAVTAILFTRSHKDQSSASASTTQNEAQQQASSAAPALQPAREQTPPVAEASPQSAPQAPDQTPAAAAPVQEQALPPAPAPPQAPAPAPAATQVLQVPPANGAIAEQVMPDVLPKALASIHGKFNVKIRVTVDSAGNVSDATYESEGPSQYFAKAALQAAQKWKFKPAQAGGQAVPSAWILQFLFARDGAEVTTAAAH
jgi:TonB family protein